MALAPIKEKYAELVGFFQYWIPAYLPSAGLYLMGQSAQRPPNPYIAFNPLSSIDVVGIDEHRINPTTGVEHFRGQRTVTCDIFGFSDSETRFDGGDNAWEMLQELRFSLCYPPVIAALSAITCRTLDEGVVSDVSQTLNSTNEPRAMLQIMLSTVINQEVDNGDIENVNAEGELFGPDGKIVDVDISVSKT